MRFRGTAFRSLVVAAAIGLVTPALWLLTNADAWGHARSLPGFIAERWVGYLQASAVVFAIVFVFLLVFLRRRNRRY